MRRVLLGMTVALAVLGIFLVGAAVGQSQYGTPKSVIHVVVVKWKAEAADADKQRAMDGVKTMAAAIPGIKNVWVKADRVQPREFNTAFAIEFESRAAADAYVEHPAHKEWEKIYLPIREESRSLQITNP